MRSLQIGAVLLPFALAACSDPATAIEQHPPASLTYFDGKHNDFGFIAQGASGLIVHLFLRSTGHLDPASLSMRASANGGFNWSDPVQVLPDTNITFGIGGGFGADNRLHVFYGSALTTWHSVSQDEGRTWSRPESVMTTGPDYVTQPYGSMISLAGRLIQPFFTQPANSGPGRYRVGILSSADNGRTWQTSILYDATGAKRLTETTLVTLGGSSVLAIARDDEPGTSMEQLLSTDGGRTWIDQGRIALDVTDGIQKSPWLLAYSDSLGAARLAMLWTNSITLEVRLAIADPAFVTSGPQTNWLFLGNLVAGETPAQGHYASMIQLRGSGDWLAAFAMEGGGSPPTFTSLRYISRPPATATPVLR